MQDFDALYQIYHIILYSWIRIHYQSL